MTKATILLRVDVDFSFGLRRGVPFLLRLFEELGVRATFCVVMGPDTLSKHGARVSQNRYLRRLFSFGLGNLLWHVGPALIFRHFKPATVGMGNKHLLEKIISGGHELSIHGYDHADWANRCREYTATETRQQVDAAVSEFRKMFGEATWSWVSPNWRCNDHLFAYLETLGGDYSSDARGCEPFYPRIGSSICNVLQLPVSLPCLHELSQCGISKFSWANVVRQCLQPDYNHLNIHAYYEGLFERRAFSRFMGECVRDGLRFIPLSSGYELAVENSVNSDELSHVKLPGGIGEVSCQRRFLTDNYFAKIDPLKAERKW